MARGTQEVQFAFPTPEGWERNLLIGLFVAYLAEVLIVQFAYSGLYELLGWIPTAGWAESGALWQPMTRFFVQGPGAIGVLIRLAVLFFALPVMSSLVSQQGGLQAVGAAAIGGTVLPLLVGLGITYASSQPLLGWGALVMVPFVLLGLIQPKATVYLIVFPLEARWLLWAALAIPLFMIVISPPEAWMFESIGVWAGAVAWHEAAGPGARRRQLHQERTRVESELEKLRRFEVIEGGRSGNAPPDDPDELVN